MNNFLKFLQNWFCIIKYVLFFIIFMTSTMKSNAQLDFQSPIEISSPGSPQKIGYGDFDGDGNLDVAFSTAFKISLYVVFSEEDGQLSKQLKLVYSNETAPSLNYGFDLTPFAVADFNLDGKDDIVMFENNTNSDDKIFIFYSEGKTFSAPVIIKAYEALQSADLQPVDFNKDGKQDFIVSFMGNNELFLYLNSNAGFVLQRIPISRSLTDNLIINDINQDGNPDVLTSDYGVAVSIYHGDGINKLTFIKNISAPNFIQELYADDISGDGLNDIIVVTTPNTKQIECFINDGGGNFNNTPIEISQEPFKAISTFDFNQDGKKDIAVGVLDRSGFVILKNNGNGSYSETFQGFGNSFIKSLYITNSTTPGSKRILGGTTGKAIFDYTIDNTGNLTQNKITITGLVPSTGKVADLNKDGLTDLISVNAISNSISISYGLLDKNFSDPVSYYIGVEVGGIDVGDFNSDNILDIVYTSTYNTSSPSTGILLSSSNDSYSLKVYANTNPSLGVAVGNFNNDTKLDFVTAGTQFIGDGVGNFNSTIFNLSFVPYDVVKGDFNNDTFDDVAFGSNSGVTFQFSNGNGILTSPINVATTKPLAKLKTVNINGDHLDDIIGYNYSGTIISLINQNSTSYSENVIEFGSDFGHVAVADFNNDNKLDLAVHYLYEKVKFFLGNQDYSYSEHQIISLGQFSQSYIEASDLDNDNKSDLILFNFTIYEEPITLLYNDLVFTPASAPTPLTISNLTDKSISLSIQKGDGNGRLVAIREASNTLATPLNNTFYSANSKIGEGSNLGQSNFVVLAANETHVDITGLKEGTSYSITAFEYSANSKKTIIKYLTSSLGTVNFTSKKNQTITPPVLTEKTIGDAPFNISPTATSSLTVSSQVISGGITVLNSTITLLNEGPVKLRFSQAGSNEYMPAPNVEITFCINPVVPSISYTPSANGKYTLVSSSTTNNVWLKNNLVIDGQTSKNIEVTPDGTYNVKVDYSGCSNTSASVANQTINFTTIAAKEEGQPDFTLTASASSSLPVSYEVVSGGVTMNTSTIKINAPGPSKIKAMQAGNNSFFPANPVEQTFCVNPKTPTISINSTGLGLYTLTSSSDMNNMWFMNDKPISGATSKTYAPIQDGIYSVKVDYSGCSSTSIPTTNLITGIEELTESLSIFPNPTSDKIYIKWSNQNPTLNRIIILDALGKQNVVNYNLVEELISVDIQRFPIGFFTLILQTSKGAVVKKIVKK